MRRNARKMQPEQSARTDAARNSTEVRSSVAPLNSFRQRRPRTPANGTAAGTTTGSPEDAGTARSGARSSGERAGSAASVGRAAAQTGAGSDEAAAVTGAAASTGAGAETGAGAGADAIGREGGTGRKTGGALDRASYLPWAMASLVSRRGDWQAASWAPVVSICVAKRAMAEAYCACIACSRVLLHLPRWIARA